MNSYDRQAIDFLKRNNINFAAQKLISGKCPMWCTGNKHIHGDEHVIVLSRGNDKFTVHFWNSFTDKKAGKRPTAYDVLSCLTKYNPGSFEDFCSEYGYDTDSRKDEQTYKAALQEWQDVNLFFTAEEIEQLQEVN